MKRKQLLKCLFFSFAVKFLPLFVNCDLCWCFLCAWSNFCAESAVPLPCAAAHCSPNTISAWSSAFLVPVQLGLKMPRAASGMRSVSHRTSLEALRGAKWSRASHRGSFCNGRFGGRAPGQAGGVRGGCGLQSDTALLCCRQQGCLAGQS